jgi:hypothetical protein
LRPAALVRLGLRFVWQSAVAAADVARRALDPNLPLQPGFVLCPMRLAPGPARNAFLRPLEPSAGYAGGRVGPEGRAAHPLLPPVGIVIGVYLLWAGADEPGGAFQGGALLAAMWILAMMAGLTAAPAVSDRRLRLVLIAGPAVFLAIGLAGFALADAFLAYPEVYAKPLIIVIEVAKILSVAATLGLLVAGPPERAPRR